jgi:uncharacterized protein with HEPN domain
MSARQLNAKLSMHSDAIKVALYDIRDNIQLAQEFVQALTFDAFSASRLHFYATSRAIQIISEASRRLPDDVRTRHPELPWRAIRDTGNVYRHRYDNVTEARVWATVHHDLPPLLAAIHAELSDHE